MPVNVSSPQANTAATDQSPSRQSDAVPVVQRLRFIPYRRADLLAALRASIDGDQGQKQRRFDAGARQIERAFGEEFHALRQAIKDAYAPLDPDADTRAVAASAERPDSSASLAGRLAALLERANYEKLTGDDLERAFRSASLFQIRLQVDLSDFDEMLLYCRGASRQEETVSHLFGLLDRRVSFTNYERVVLYLRFADRGATGDPDLPPGRVMIKLFQNVPDADLEMLFPNTRVAMRWSDRLLIGVPALASGAIVAFTKLGAPLVLLGALFGYWLGLHSEPVTLDRKGLIAIGAGLGALGAYLWKQWSKYRQRKARFRQALTRNLYFKLLDNNAGVLLRVLDDAEDSECKEAWVALRFLLDAPEGVSARELDAVIEAWFAGRLDAHIDFEIDDALRKLADLGLAREEQGRWFLLEAAHGDL